MKVAVLAVVLVLVCVVLFVAGVVSPRRSRAMQERVDRVTRRGEHKGDEKAGRVGDATRKSLEKMRRGADASAETGRRVHDRFVD